MDRQILKSVIIDQHAVELPEPCYEREAFAKIEHYKKASDIVVITGLRRTGKSTLLQMLRSRSEERDFFLNFDDDRLVLFTIEDFQTLYELWIELYGVQRTFYFDEIQNIPGWERFARRLHDQGMKVYVTGSSANLLSAELGTKLTGRHLTIEVFPFSFREYVRGQEPSLLALQNYTTEQKGMMLHLFSRYYSQGGIPEYIRTEIKDALHKLYEGILFRDIITRFKLKEQKAIQKMVFFLASNLSKPCSFKSICSITGLKSATTISEYSYYLEQAYLCFFLNRYSHSLKEQEQSPKKVYFIDHILAKTVGFQISANYGRALENIVFIELKRRGKEIYYHKEKKECDFLIKNEEAYQVCASWRDLTTKEREVEGLLEAMEIYNLAEGYILTEDQEETIQAQGKMIHVIPLWKWLTR